MAQRRREKGGKKGEGLALKKLGRRVCTAALRLGVRAGSCVCRFGRRSEPTVERSYGEGRHGAGGDDGEGADGGGEGEVPYAARVADSRDEEEEADHEEAVDDVDRDRAGCGDEVVELLPGQGL